MTLFRYLRGFMIWPFFSDFLFLTLWSFSFYLFSLGEKKTIAKNSFSTLWNIYIYLWWVYLGVIRGIFGLCQSPPGFYTGGAWFPHLIHIVNLSFKKLYHFMIFNKCTRTHFPSSIQSCTPAGVIYHCFPAREPDPPSVPPLLATDARSPRPGRPHIGLLVSSHSFSAPCTPGSDWEPGPFPKQPPGYGSQPREQGLVTAALHRPRTHLSRPQDTPLISCRHSPGSSSFP